MPLFPISNYIALVCLGLVVVLMAFMPDMRIVFIVAPAWFILQFIGFKMKKGIRSFF